MDSVTLTSSKSQLEQEMSQSKSWPCNGGLLGSMSETMNIYIVFKCLSQNSNMRNILITVVVLKYAYKLFDTLLSPWVWYECSDSLLMNGLWKGKHNNCTIVKPGRHYLITKRSRSPSPEESHLTWHIPWHDVMTRAYCLYCTHPPNP